ncbi:lysoplasmalogenase [Wenzhouxiangella sp. XN79A]|uniref:lysoplasmalogenase n=1 Tax=Wenzhouxiangella sp. XN79A TaxID=2724193 RepID=UPI00144A6F54|nr:lysoplasmalogenase [Wenzhouxiangella sp. XN79A]NKI35211.1 lysoplasmalogenase [Wenzhouxiangella sp. XN79A]
MLARIAPPLFIALAVSYWLTLFLPAWPGEPVHKALPMLLAAWTLAAALPRRTGLPLALGFVFAAAGDAFLAVDRQALLIQALASFLVTQLAYSVAFVHRAAPLHERLVARLAAIAFGAAMLAWMWPGLDEFRLPVTAYVAVLALMTVLAAGVGDRLGRVFAGAALFMLADSLIGVNRFVGEFAHSERIIVAIYTTGQYLIFTGALRVFGRPAAATDPRGAPS